MRWLVIANPAAGRASQMPRAVAALGTLNGTVPDVRTTRAPGDATCLARDLGLRRVPVAIEALRHPRLGPLDLPDMQVTLADRREQRRPCASTVAAGCVTQFVATGRGSLAWLRQMLHKLSVLAGSRRFGPAELTQGCGIGAAFEEPCTLMANGELLRGVRRLDVARRPRAIRCATVSQ